MFSPAPFIKSVDIWLSELHVPFYIYKKVKNDHQSTSLTSSLSLPLPPSLSLSLSLSNSFSLFFFLFLLPLSH